MMASPSSDHEIVFYCRSNDKEVEARGILLDDGVLRILKGSTAKGELGFLYQTTQNRLLEEGVIRQTGNIFIFEKDYTFHKPSPASCFILGRSNSNGWIDWKTAGGQTLSAIYRMERQITEIDKITQPDPKWVSVLPPLSQNQEGLVSNSMQNLKTTARTLPEDSHTPASYIGQELPTNWLKFYVWILIPANIILVPTTVWIPLLHKFSFSEILHNRIAMFLVAWQSIEIIGLIFLFVGLYRRKYWGWVLNWIFMIYRLITVPITEAQNTQQFIILGLVLGLLLFLPNYIYFKRRRYLFDGRPRTEEWIDRTSFLGCLAQIIYFGMGLFQLAAILGGIEDWLGWPKWVAVLIAMPVAYIPVLGTIMGIMGAIKSFGWSPLFAILLFCWPFILYFIVFAGSSLSALPKFLRKTV